MGVFHARAIVFDKDGVLLDTMPMIREAWAEWARSRGLDAAEVLSQIHMTGYELLERFAPSSDPAAEFRWIGAHQAAAEPDIVAYAGAAELLQRLQRDAWAVVTSARREVSIRHLRIGGLPLPEVLVAAEDTPRGKPYPAGYRLAAQRLGVPPELCVAVEDAPAGVRAARGAGMRVIAVTTTHEADALTEADAAIQSLDQLDVVSARGRLEVRIRLSS